MPCSPPPPPHDYRYWSQSSTSKSFIPFVPNMSTRHPRTWSPTYHHKAQMSCDYCLTWWLHTVLNFLIFKMTAATAQAAEATTRDGITFDLFQQFLQLRFHHIRLCGSVRLCCLMSSDVGWRITIRDKLRPMRSHGSILLYVHGNQKAR